MIVDPSHFTNGQIKAYEDEFVRALPTKELLMTKNNIRDL